MSFWKRGATSLPLILLAAFTIRGIFAWNYIHPRPERALGTIPFLFEPGNIAYSLVQGKGFSSPFRVDTGPTAWMTPVYPALLALLFKIFGTYTFHAFLAAVGLNIAFSTATCIPVFAITKRIAGEFTAAVAAWLWAVFPNTILNSYESLWDATLAGLLAALILWMTLSIADSSRRLVWICYGLLWGLTLMTNPSLLAMFPLLLGWLIYHRRRQLRPAVANATLAAAVALLCCVPWTIRNYRVFHTFIPLRSALGLILWLGNNDQIQGRWPGLLHPISNQPERIKYMQLGEIQYMREKEHDAIHYLLSHPAQVVEMTGGRIIATWTGGSAHPLADLQTIHSNWFRAVLFFNVATALLALWGVTVLLLRRSPFVFPVSVFPLVFPWAYYLTVTTPRYRLVIDPIVMVLAAVGATAIGKSRSRAIRSKAPQGYTTRSPNRRSNAGGLNAT